MLEGSFGLITTNYTPIINSIRLKNVSQINGSLNLFEYPFELTVEDFSIEPNLKINHDMFFPFIFGTSPVKPIVHKFQIEALNKLNEILAESDTLIIIGYGLNEDDNHLNSYIREILMKQSEETKKRVIYCHYYKGENFDKESIEKYILSILRLYKIEGNAEDSFENLIILENNGNIEDIFSKIKDYVS